ncbi:MAG: CAF17-like 4Fe-4S cluster assembly/insertion protein YgfZ [Planctomycetaceae bacterium]
MVESTRSSTDDARNQYAAARTQAALFDMPGRMHVEIGGADRAKFVHNFCTNDVKGLQPGQGCEAFVTSVQGKVLAHVFIFCEPEALWIDSVAGSGERLTKHLSRYQITEDVTFADRSGELATLYLVGPQAAAVLSAAGIEPLGVSLAHRAAPTAENVLRIRRNDFLRLPGYELVAAPAVLAPLRGALLAAGAAPADRAAFESLRIEAGFPWYGIDATDANLAQELGRTAQAVSFTKGCYLGQEPIARIDALGHVNQQLRVLRLERGPAPQPGSDVLSAEADAQLVGHVTSAAWSYQADAPVALAYLRRGHDASGLKVAVRAGQELIPAVVWWTDD